jgi:LacI family transcriptional regulator
MRITLQHVAKKCGVSIHTVSKVLGGHAHLFRPETREAVEKAAHDLGYLPNQSARAMRQGRFGGIALISSTRGYLSNLPPSLLSGLTQSLNARDLHLTFGQFPDELLTSETQAPKVLRALMADGFLVNYHARVPPALKDLLERHRFPCIWLNYKRSRDAVYLDDVKAAKELTQHLIERGHRRIAYVDYVHCLTDRDEHYSAFDRHDGYLAAMKAAGLTPNVIGIGSFEQRGDLLARSRAVLESAPRPTAIVTYSDSELLPFSHAAAWLHLRIPEDLSLATFGDGQMHSFGRSPTRMLNPWEDLGQAAVEMLGKKIAAPDRAIAARALPFAFEPGETSAPPA